MAEVAAWALDEKELKRLQRNAEFFGIDKTESFGAEDTMQIQQEKC